MSLRTTLDFVAAVSAGSEMTIKRSKADFLADRIHKAAMTTATATGFAETLMRGMQVDLGKIGSERFGAFLSVENGPAVVAWLRDNANVAAMLCFTDKEERGRIADTIDIPELSTGFRALDRAPFDVPVRVECLSPLAHGADEKRGNATIFRRMPVMRHGCSAVLPYYAGNALRGQVRDALADHLVTLLGIDGKRLQVVNWFFHTIYAGGALEEASTAAKAIDARMGVGGTIKSDAVREFRDMLPGLSLLGCALGNRVLPGRVNFGDLRPRCTEWGTGPNEARELFCWEYLTRRDDNESRQDGEHHGMIANTECLKIGTILDGGVDYMTHINEMERSALDFGLRLVADRGYLGAENRRGLGQVHLAIDGDPDDTLYRDWIESNVKAVLDYLLELTAVKESECTLLSC